MKSPITLTHERPSEKDLQRQWVERWRAAGRALAEVRADELRSLTAAQALAATECLLQLASPPRDHVRWRSSGLVEQQQLFQRLRREQRSCSR